MSSFISLFTSAIAFGTIIMFGALFMGKVTPNLSFTPMDGPVDAGKLFGMIAFAAAATLWAYEGWTNLNSVAEEIHNPKKNLPLSLIIATGGISKIVLPLCSHTITYDGALLMKGLLHLYEKNRKTE